MEINIEALAWQVKDLRLKKKPRWNQQMLSDASGVSKATISRIESMSQGASPGRDILERLAQALGVSVEVLVAWPPGKGPIPLASQGDAEVMPYRGTAGADPDDGDELADVDTMRSIFTLRVTGDCLVPDIEPGDRVEVSRIQPVRVGDTVSVIYGGRRMLKRVTDRNGIWTLESRHGVLRLPLEEFELEGVVIETLTRKSKTEL
jgi:transcriptional regulator with XRE-family HTH domain